MTIVNVISINRNEILQIYEYGYTITVFSVCNLRVSLAIADNMNITHKLANEDEVERAILLQ